MTGRNINCTPDTLSLEESRELLALIKTGKLCQVEEWIQKGKSIRVSPKSRDEPLHLALRNGFFSLVELLARHTTAQKLKDEVLIHAVRRQRFDVVKMLVDAGADPKSVHLADVLRSWDPEMMRYFLGLGTELFADDALAYALTSGIEAALGFYMDCRRNHPEWAADLKQLLDMALAIHCREGNEDWVVRLMWAGGDPYARVWDMYRKDIKPDRSWIRISGAVEAAMNGNIKVLKLLNLDPAHPETWEVLGTACQFLHEKLVHYLLDLGVEPNDKANGGSSVLDTVLFHIDWGLKWRRIMSPEETAAKCLRMARDLIRHKALWKPDACNLRAARRAACEIGPWCVLEFVSLLKRPGVCDPEDLRKLVGSRLMRDMLNKA